MGEALRDAESFTLELLAKFQKKLSAAKEKQSQRLESESEDTGGPAPEKESRGTADIVEGDDDDWLAHELHFEEKGAVLAKDASTKGDDWFDIYDPRNPLNKRKREEGGKDQSKMNKVDRL